MNIVPRPIITLTTDFGLKDHYIASVKGIILRICPNVQIIDVSHLISKYNIKEAAFVLSQASTYFPKGTIHIAIIDPDVGTPRRRIVILCKHSYFVGPDNGVLMPAASREGILKIIEVINMKKTLIPLSSTFEGRDVFAPIAAHIANGMKPTDLGPELRKARALSWGVVNVSSISAEGLILHIDDFGNIITNIPNSFVEKWQKGSIFQIIVGQIKKIGILSKSYSDSSGEKPLVIVGSGGFIEIAVNKDNAAILFKTHVNSRISLEKIDHSEK
jgi:hypothetical protein